MTTFRSVLCFNHHNTLQDFFLLKILGIGELSLRLCPDDQVIWALERLHLLPFIFAFGQLIERGHIYYPAELFLPLLLKVDEEEAQVSRSLLDLRLCFLI